MLGQILFIDAVGAHQRQRIAPSLGGEDDGIGRDGDATFKHQASQGVGGGVAVETEPAKEGIPRRAREVAPRFEQGFEEILGAFVATVVLSSREVAPQAGEEGFHTPESEGEGGHRPWLPCFGGRGARGGRTGCVGKRPGDVGWWTVCANRTNGLCRAVALAARCRVPTGRNHATDCVKRCADRVRCTIALRPKGGRGTGGVATCFPAAACRYIYKACSAATEGAFCRFSGGESARGRHCPRGRVAQVGVRPMGHQREAAARERKLHHYGEKLHCFGVKVDDFSPNDRRLSRGWNPPLRKYTQTLRLVDHDDL